MFHYILKICVLDFIFSQVWVYKDKYSYFTFTPHLPLSTRKHINNTSVTRCMGLFPHWSILCNIHWVSYNLTPSWLCVPGDSIRCHRVRLTPTRLPLLQTPITSRGLQVTFNFCLTWLQIRVSHNALLGFDYLLEWLMELRETLVYHFIT